MVAMHVALFSESRRDGIIIYIIVVNTILNNEFYQLHEFIFQTTRAQRSQRFTVLLSPADGLLSTIYTIYTITQLHH
jgi:hypothetical protein